MNADRVRRFPLCAKDFKTGAVLGRSFGNQLLREIVMSRKNSRLVAIAAACALLPAASALASQGPGGGMGSASNFTQVAMAILVYGASVLVVGAGLIGALRRR
ncbi:MAG: hypothetical protein QOD11_2973 [Bradyrhizobium sp.]|jgi:hypothetical protein|nr:hypothetical protein [Bradyrhizobium sp.]